MITFTHRCEQKEEGEEPSTQKAITDASTAGLELSSPCTQRRMREFYTHNGGFVRKGLQYNLVVVRFVITFPH